MDVSEAKDRMLEVENLTDALEDDDANWLLDWGTKQVGTLIQGIADDDQAGEKVTQLMGVMRSVNRITGDRNAAPPDELADDIHQLVDKYNAAFGTSVSPSDDEIKALVGRIGTLGERDTMQALLDSVAQPSAAPSASTAQSAPTPSAAASSDAQPAAAQANTPGEATAQPVPNQQDTPPAAQSQATKQDDTQSGQEESHA